MKHREYITELLNHPLSGINDEDISYLEFIGKEFYTMSQIQRLGYPIGSSKELMEYSFDKFCDLPTFLNEVYGDEAPDPQQTEFTWAEDIWNLYFSSDIIN